MRLKISVLLCITLMYCMLTNGRVSHMEFLVERWHRCGRVTERVVNGMLLVMVLLNSVIYCRGMPVISNVFLISSLILIRHDVWIGN